MSVGLIPENELSRRISLTLDPLTSGPLVDQNRQTSMPGVFAAGNVLHVHDLADFASEEALLAGHAACRYVNGGAPFGGKKIPVKAGDGLRTVVPQLLEQPSKHEADIKFFIRASRPAENVALEITSGGETIVTRRLQIVRPSEMIVVTVLAKDLDKIKDVLELRLVRR